MLIETCDALYENPDGHWILTIRTIGCIPPSIIKCGIPERGIVELQYLGSVNDIYHFVRKNNTVKILMKHFNFSQQHLNRIDNDMNEFPKNPDMITKLLQCIKLPLHTDPRFLW